MKFLNIDWISSSIEFIILFLVGAFIIREAVKVKKDESLKIKGTLLFLGTGISLASLGVYLFKNMTAFSLILKWAGICLLVMICIGIIITIVGLLSERDVNAKRKSKCRAEIVAICGNMKYSEKIYDIGYDLTAKGYIVLYPTLVPESKKIYINRDDIDREKIKLADRVYIVSENQDIDPSLNRLIKYSQELCKKIVYEIGDKVNIDDDIVRKTLSMDRFEARESLGAMGYTSTTVKDIIDISDKIRLNVTYQDIELFMNNRIGLDYIKKQYSI